MRHLGRALIASLGTAVLLSGAPVSASVRSARASTTAHGDAQFGAVFAAWQVAHPRDVADCPTGACYGPVVASVAATPQFSFVTISAGRVVGYDQALRRGTPLLQAELEVAQMFPADVTMSSSVQVVRRDTYGNSCAVYDLHAKSLVRLFGRHGFGNDGGNVGVELATLRRNGGTSYDPHNLDVAIVIPTWVDKSINC